MTCLLEENICLHLANKLCVYYQDGVLLYVKYNGNTPYYRSQLIRSNQMTLKPLKAYNLV